MDIRPFSRFDHLVVGRVEPPVEDILADARVEKIDILLNYSDVPSERIEGDAVDVFSVDEDLARRDVVEMRDQVADRGLSAARRADERKGLTLSDLQADVVENLL